MATLSPFHTVPTKPLASEVAWLESITRPPAPRKILLVEDDAELRHVFREVLAVYHCTVAEAADGDQAITAFDREKPDVVILDLRLPLVDGFSVFAYIRQRDKSLPVIIVTGQLDSYVIERIYGSGYAIFARKPDDINGAFFDAVLAPLFLQRLPVGPPVK